MKLHEIPGNELAKRAIEVALAGQHSIALVQYNNSMANELVQAIRELSSTIKTTIIKMCPCGNFGDKKHECHCTTNQLKKHLKQLCHKVHNFDIVVETECYPKTSKYQPEETEAMLDRINKASSHFCSYAIGKDAGEMLEHAILKFKLNKQKIVAIALTIARLDCQNTIGITHIVEAIQYQSHYFMAPLLIFM